MFTAERLRALLSYDPDTGVFVYCVRTSQRTPPGTIAGSVNNEGYRNIRIGGVTYKAHRLAWLYMTGEWPAPMIDHIDGNRDNNRFINLREATRSQNLANSKINRSGKNLPKGIRFVGSRWRATIQCNGKRRFIGSFKSQEEAVAAYAEAARNLFGNFARG